MRYWYLGLLFLVLWSCILIATNNIEVDTDVTVEGDVNATGTRFGGVDDAGSEIGGSE